MKMTKRLIKMVMIGVLFFIAFAVFNYLFMRLWNWLMPELFGIREIGYWQALGVLILSKILFGGLSGGHGRPSRVSRRRMIARWERMTPEERERFRRGLGEECNQTTPL